MTVLLRLLADIQRATYPLWIMLTASLGTSAENAGTHVTKTENIDATGRIGLPVLPAGLPDPDHWRFTPEKGSKPKNVLQRELDSTYIVPEFEYSRDVGYLLGVWVSDEDVFDDSGRESAKIYAAYSTLDQEDYEFTITHYLHSLELPGQGVIVNERGSVSTDVEYIKTLTSRFFGFGPKTPAHNETDYTDEVAEITVRWEDSVPYLRDCLISAGITADHHNLSPGRARGIRSTDATYPSLIADADRQTQGWGTVGISYDTRDNIQDAHRGYHIGIEESALLASNAAGRGRVTSARAGIAKMVPPMCFTSGPADDVDSPADTVVLECFLESVAGDLPFYDLPSLGGASSLRGYIEGRWRDRVACHASAEYRMWFLPRGLHLTDAIEFERIGLAPFIDAGTVAASIDGLGSAPIRTSYGMGLRLALDRTTIIRVDVGASQEGLEVNVAYGLAY